MKASELIAELEKVIAEGGDLEVRYFTPDEQCEVVKVFRTETTSHGSVYQYIEIQ